VLILKDFKDVAEMVKEKPGEFRKVLANNLMSAMDFYFGRYLDVGDKSEIKDKKEGIRAVLKKIKILPSAIEREYWLKILARKVSVSEGALQEEMKILESVESDKQKSAEVSVSRDESLSRAELISRRIISASLADEKGVSILKEWEIYMPDNFRKIIEIIKKGEKAEEGTELDRLINLIYLRSGMVEEKIEDLGRELKIEWLRAEKQSCLRKVRMIEQSGGNLDEIMARFKKVSEELDRIVGDR